MKFSNIEVSGIRNIVFNKAVQWSKGVDGTWMTLNAEMPRIRHHEEMMKIINHLKSDRRYRMWVNGDSLNIENKHKWVCMQCGKISETIHDHWKECSP